jgi:glycosyltransferase involved in cell wall biosynthesis
MPRRQSQVHSPPAPAPEQAAGADLLTNIPVSPDCYWGRVSEACALGPRAARRLRMLGPVGRLLGACSVAVQMLRRRRRFAAAVVASDASGNLFVLLQSLLPSRPLPTVMIDCLWYLPSSRIGRWLKAVQLRLEARSVNRFVVWASHEVEGYARAFGLPEEKLVFIPFHVTLTGYRYTVHEGDYIFSGGNGDRDYATLVRAVRDLPVPVIVATSNGTAFGGEPIPDHVQVRRCGHAEFRELMAGASLVVVPMQGGLLHSGGQQTYLNAMAMGKPVIVLDPRGARDYITDGRDGIVLDYGDSEELRAAIVRLRARPEVAAALGAAAQAHIHGGPYRTEDCMRAVADLARRAARQPRLAEGESR